ncbi:M24 family metallopeptidase [Povalibacter sp.]|uniref:M24 family metallopeptidase n=1 Tax=Povalibacter sp. TaxID=1962978 RepID=UPI002F42E293
MLIQPVSVRIALLACCAMTVSACGSGISAPSADKSQTAAGKAASVTTYGIPQSKERFEIQTRLIADKLDRALLPAMRNQKIDMWIVLDREYNPDPVHVELGGRGTGVRAAYIFYDNGSDKPEKIYFGSHEQPANSVIARVYDVKGYYGYSKEGLTPHLRKAVFDRAPKRIGINMSPTLPSADGITATLRDYLAQTIGPEFAKRLVSAELVIRDFRLSRTALETELYTDLVRWSAMWMEEALSTQNVTTGKTTAADIAWWLKDRALELGLTGGGTVRVVRSGELLPVHDPDIAMEPGDIIGIDGGLEYNGYKVDIKRTAYILRSGENAMPAGLQAAWKATHDMADRYVENMQIGKVGHEIWAAVNAQAESLGYHAVGPDAGGDAVTGNRPEVGIYGHSVGTVAHDIGARIAANIPFAYGDRVRYPLVEGEWVSIEFHVSTPVEEWDGKTWYARFEETGQLTRDGIKWLVPIQKDLFLIQPAG